MQNTTQIHQDIINIFQNADTTESSIKINSRLDQKLYVSTNKIIETIGGKWNRKRKCHTFNYDPRTIIDNIIKTATLDTSNLCIDVIKSAMINGTQAKAIPDLFPTPSKIVQQLIGLANLAIGQRILEPSAGAGNIVSAIIDRSLQSEIVVVEINAALATELKQRYPNVIVYNADFLTLNDIGLYDRIIMNPPFSQAADIKHILHARSKLVPSGKIVTICSAGARQIKQIKSIAEQWIDIPAKSFKKEGTNIKTVIAVVNA